MSPKQFNLLLQNIKSKVPEINKAWLVVDDSQLTKNLAEISSEDNTLLIGVLPNYGTSGFSPDAWKDTTQAMIMILEKTDYSENDHDQFIEIFERTYQTAQKVKNEMMMQALEGCQSFLRGLYVDSIKLEPEWKKADCNGWNLSFDIE